MSDKKSRPMSLPLRVSSEIERLFDDLIQRRWGFCREIRGWDPSIDVYENDDGYLLEADLPGVKLEDIGVDVKDGAIVLRGFRSLEQVRGGGHFIEMERSSGHFMRRVSLPETVDESGIKADFRDGVLRVTIPKKR